MQAHPGDWLLVNGNRPDELNRKGLVLEVRGPDGAPPYIVRWLEDDHVSWFYPGPGAAIRHRDALQPALAQR